MTPQADDSDSDMTVRSEPPSPCLWASVRSPRALAAVAQESSEQDASLPDAQDEQELELSPASQLNVLSQISAMGELEMRRSAVATSRAAPIRSHIWAPFGVRKAANNNNKKSAIASKKTLALKAKRSIVIEREHKAASPKPAAPKRRRVVTNPLAEDMLDWDTCSEEEMMFAGLESSTKEDEWRYEDLSDSDFDSHI